MTPPDIMERAREAASAALEEYLQRTGRFPWREIELEEVARGDRLIARIHFTATADIDTPDWKAGTTIHNDYVDFATVRGGKIVDYSAVIGPLLPDGGMK